jgi:DNA-binding SARP family transcriptional activator/Tfp pilus assembly protein PilF
MELRLLGPVQLVVAGRPVELGPTKQRAVLAALLVDADRPVPTEALIDRVWGEDPPLSVRGTLYSYVARLRVVLRRAVDGDGDPPRLEHGADGYRLIIDGCQVDLDRFHRLVDEARVDGHDDARRAALLDEARCLWRGPALGDLPGRWAARTRELLDYQRLDALVQWARALLRVGRAAEVIAPLRAALGERPLVEPVVATLMEALLREGRSAEALDCYAEIRRRCVQELGVEPGPELRRMHLTVLSQDGQVAQPYVVPAQLPLDVRGFTGRSAELARLDELVAAADAEPGTVGVLALCGGAGVGKTTLAVHWAHRIAGRFPDGQLFLNLRGYHPVGAAMPTAEAIRLVLDALGVPADRLPTSEDARVGLYRSLLAGRRILVVLDNAASADQVRPLLPGAPGCVAVVTSRDRLTGLGAGQAAHPLTVDVLPANDARDLIAARVGAARAAAEPQAVTALVERCARLPLALAVVAARAAAQPGVPLADLATELAEDRLEALADPDPAGDVRQVLSWSYRTLTAGAAGLFRLVGWAPGPDIDADAAASVAGVARSQARRLLTELSRAHLVSQPAADRYAMHDLLREYAHELALAEDSPHRRRAALHRVLDHYAHRAHAAARLISPHREPVALGPPRSGVVLSGDFADQADAQAWLADRQDVLISHLRAAARAGLDAHTWQLAWALGPVLDRGGNWRDLAGVTELALAAALRLGDRSGEAYSHRMLGRARTRQGDAASARIEYELALRICEDAGDDLGRAHTHLGLAWLCEQQQALREALDHVRRAGTLYAGAGHIAGQAGALNQAGWYYAQLGEFHQAIGECDRALALQEATGDRYGQASTWDSLGFAHHHLGRHRKAARCYQRAIELHRGNGDRYREASTRSRLADCHAAAGDARAARGEWTAALAILRELNHPDAVGIGVKLRHPPSLDPRPPGRQ